MNGAYPTDDWIRKAASQPDATDLAVQIMCASGVFSAVFAAIRAADEMSWLIDRLRTEGLYDLSDRMRTLCDDITEETNRLTWLTGQPPRPFLSRRSAA